MADTKRAISVESLQATTNLIEQLRLDAEAIIASLNQTGGVAPVWTNTNSPSSTVGGYTSGSPATPAQGLEFAAAMDRLLFPNIAPTISFVSGTSIPYLASSFTIDFTITVTPNTAGASANSWITLFTKR